MNYEFDAAKNSSNVDKHGLSLARVEDFEWESAVVSEDTRQQYTERRFHVTGYIGERLHVMVYCHRTDAVRVISLRKANTREVKNYAKT
ncbi:BrnT family toxin [Glaciimonas sp. PAMC28666]|uniref:BrnT family toxin n=1 Tax=Glaciimonas sp. PAMC28666 TaxID=2807626 RepID=UPI001963D06E|nr:BrnT family toxin [Glaciimonas sp. PAMC28666]QRX82308.1 BrnT family toxin [Glaciimonas sp. PAMC28666]